jgi:phosphotransferase system  glucose/maltose/N-acetylglucosamine-specific IIC component
MEDISLLFLAIGMIVVFVGPFFVISAIKDRKEAQQKQEEKQKQD